MKCVGELIRRNNKCFSRWRMLGISKQPFQLLFLLIYRCYCHTYNLDTSLRQKSFWVTFVLKFVILGKIKMSKYLSFIFAQLFSFSRLFIPQLNASSILLDQNLLFFLKMKLFSLSFHLSLFSLINGRSTMNFSNFAVRNTKKFHFHFLLKFKSLKCCIFQFFMKKRQSKNIIFERF